MSNAHDETEVEEAGSLELAQGDVAMVVRADGEVEFMVFAEDEASDEYEHSMRMIEYMKFVLENQECLDLFEKSLQNPPGMLN